MRFILSSFVALFLTACGAAYDTADTDLKNGNGDERMPSRRVWGQTIHWQTGVAGLTNTVINVAEPVTSSCGAPTTWGIQVQGIINNNAFNGKADLPSLKGVVTWGVLGGMFTAYIDVTVGTSFNLVADTVRVDIVDTTVYSGAPATIEPFVVTGSASPIAIPKVVPVTFTQLMDLTQPVPLVNVPPFAKKVSVTLYKNAIANSEYAFYALDATMNNYIMTTFVGAGGELQDVQLPGNSFAVGVDAWGAAIQRMYVVFELDL